MADFTNEQLIRALRGMARRDDLTALQTRALLAGADGLRYIERYLKDIPEQSEDEAIRETDEIVSLISSIMSRTAIRVTLYTRSANGEDVKQVTRTEIPQHAVAAVMQPSRSEQSQILTALAAGSTLVVVADKGMIL